MTEEILATSTEEGCLWTAKATRPSRVSLWCRWIRNHANKNTSIAFFLLQLVFLIWSSSSLWCETCNFHKCPIDTLWPVASLPHVSSRRGVGRNKIRIEPWYYACCQSRPFFLQFAGCKSDHSCKVTSHRRSLIGSIPIMIKWLVLWRMLWRQHLMRPVKSDSANSKQTCCNYCPWRSHSDVLLTIVQKLCRCVGGAYCIDKHLVSTENRSSKQKHRRLKLPLKTFRSEFWNGINLAHGGSGNQMLDALTSTFRARQTL